MLWKPKAEDKYPDAVLQYPNALAFVPAAVFKFPTAIGERLLKQTDGRLVSCEPSPTKQKAEMGPAKVEVAVVVAT